MNNNNIFVAAHQERIRKTCNISADLYIFLIIIGKFSMPRKI